MQGSEVDAHLLQTNDTLCVMHRVLRTLTGRNTEMQSRDCSFLAVGHRPLRHKVTRNGGTKVLHSRILMNCMRNKQQTASQVCRQVQKVQIVTLSLRHWQAHRP